MLAVEQAWRKRGIGSSLVQRAIDKMKAMGCDEVVLETEYTNKTALAFYERQGFVRSKRMTRYYLNNGDAFRLKLWLTSPSWADVDVPIAGAHEVGSEPVVPAVAPAATVVAPEVAPAATVVVPEVAPAATTAASLDNEQSAKTQKKKKR